MALGATLFGTDATDNLDGTRGSDVLSGRGGGDIVYGEGGDDVLQQTRTPVSACLALGLEKPTLGGAEIRGTRLLVSFVYRNSAEELFSAVRQERSEKSRAPLLDSSQVHRRFSADSSPPAYIDCQEQTQAAKVAPNERKRELTKDRAPPEIWWRPKEVRDSSGGKGLTYDELELPPGYRLERDSDTLILRRLDGDGTVVAVLSVRGFVGEIVEEAALEDRLARGYAAPAHLRLPADRDSRP